MPNDDVESYNSRLVKAVREHPCLYNTSLKEYSNKLLVSNAWKSVAEKMNDEVAVCKEKWRSLRVVFSRHLHKTLSGQPRSGNRYYLYDQMQFLKPFIRCRISQVLIPYPDICEENGEHQLSDNDQIHTKIEASDIASESAENQTEEPDLETYTTKSNCADEPDNYDKQLEYLDYYSGPPKKKTRYDNNTYLNKSDQQSNCRHQFLQSLSSDVEEMTPAQFRKFRRKVTNIIDEILDNENMSNT